MTDNDIKNNSKKIGLRPPGGPAANQNLRRQAGPQIAPVYGPCGRELPALISRDAKSPVLHFREDRVTRGALPRKNSGENRFLEYRSEKT